MLVALLLLGDGEEDASADELDLGARIGPDVSYIRLDRPGGGLLELNHRDEGWTVNGYPASDSLATATVAGLDTLPPGRLISRSATNHERLGLSSGEAVRVRVGPAGEPVADFLVGGSGTDGRFVRLPGEERSYVFPAPIVGPLTRGEAEWRDYTIVEVDTASLRRIDIRRRGGPGAELARAGSSWTVDGTPADSSVVQAYLRILAGLESTGFPADSFVYAADFENPVAEVRLYAAAGENEVTTVTGVPDVSLLFSESPGHPDVLVRRADDPIVYAIDRQRANALTSPAGSFRAR